MSGRVALYQRRHLPTGARVPARSITRLGRDRARTTIGPSGSRIAARLLHAMARSGERLGIVPLCIGVGQGIAALRTRLKGTQWTNETTSPCSAPHPPGPLEASRLPESCSLRRRGTDEHHPGAVQPGRAPPDPRSRRPPPRSGRRGGGSVRRLASTSRPPSDPQAPGPDDGSLSIPLYRAGAPAREVVVEGVDARGLLRAIQAMDGHSSVASVMGGPRVLFADDYAQLDRLVGSVVLLPDVVAALEARVRGFMSARFPTSPYTLDRNFWCNVADLWDRREDARAA